jgi:prepilin-type N-terminal cleavage/methylation domain-containing protein
MLKIRFKISNTAAETIKSRPVQNNKKYCGKGLTLIELMIAIIISSVVLLGLGFALYDSQRGWNQTYDRVYSDVVTGGHIAQRVFDVIVRKSSQRFLIDNTGDWVEVYYYADANSLQVDRYARFEQSRGDLCVEYGNRNPRETLDTQVLCGNVVSCKFQQIGRSVQMVLELDDGSRHQITTTSAVLHNN